MIQSPMEGKPVNIVKAPRDKKASSGKGSRAVLNIFLLLGICVAISLFGWAEFQRRTVENRLEQTEQQLEEIRKSTQQGGAELAKGVLDKVRTHMQVPTDPEPTVATITDVEALRKTSDFYNKAENGFHLIITESRAILYNPEADVIVDVVPVQINQTSPTPVAENQGGANVATSPAPTATP